MPNFRLRAYRTGEGFQSIVIAASTQPEAVLLAEQNGRRVVEIRDEDRRAGIKLPWQRDKFSLALFSQELVTLLGAGLTLVEALDALAEHPQCAYCGDKATTVDHITAQKTDWDKGGWKDSKDVRSDRANDRSNLTGACASCNSSKGATELDQWAGPPNKR